MESLYLIRAEGNYKIGVAGDVRSRMASLQTGNPYKLELTACFEFPNAEIVERALHQKWESVRLIGEWFHLTGADVLEFCSLANALGGSEVRVGNGITNAEIEEAEEVQETIASPTADAKWDYPAMFADGWRMERAHSRGQNNRYWCWRKGGSNIGRKYLYGGTISSLPLGSLEAMRQEYQKDDE